MNLDAAKNIMLPWPPTSEQKFAGYLLPETISDNTCASFHSWRWVFTEIKTPDPELNSASLAEFS
jgi:hypothetical protein